MRLVSLWCCSFLALSLGQLMPIVEWESEDETEYIFRLISVFDKFFNYKSFISFFDELNSTVGSSSIQQRFMDHFERPVIVAGDRIGVLDTLISNRNLAIISFSGLNDRKLRVVHETLTMKESMSIFFVYKPEDGLPLTSNRIEAFFKWCSVKRMRYSLLVLKRNNVFESWGYEITTKIRIYKSDDWSQQLMKSYFFFKIGNKYQYQLLVSVFQSLPDAFVYPSTEQGDVAVGNVSLGGQTGLLLVEFMRYANGTMHISPKTAYEYFEKFNRRIPGERSVDIGANPVSNNSLAPYSPLVMSTRTCLVLPAERLISLRRFFGLFCKNITLLGFLVFYYTVTVVIKRLGNPRLSLSLVLFRTFQLSMGQSLATITFRHLALSDKFIEIFTQIYNLLFLSIFCGALTMALTTGLRMPPILDVESFLASELRIMAHAEEVQYLLRTDRFPNALFNRLLIVDQARRDQHLRSLNDSYAYIIESHKWLLIEFMQRRLRQPKLKLAPETLCGAYRHLRLPVREELPFTNPLTHFVNQVRETGLIKKWQRVGLRQAESAGMISQAPYDPPSQQALQLYFFLNVFIMYGIGIFVSLFVFILEWIYCYWKNHGNVMTV